MLPMSAHRSKADLACARPKSKIQFNGVGGLLAYISFMQGADDMSDHDKWTRTDYERSVSRLLPMLRDARVARSSA